MRNYLVLLLFFLGYAGKAEAQSGSTGEDILHYKIMLAGASFAYPQNGWFEIGCKKLGTGAVNKALGSGGSVVTLANAMAEDSFYSREELDEIDAFVIMHVHDRDVYTGEGLKEDLSEYRAPFGKDDYAEAYDYVIKKYITDCFNQKSNPVSKYYGLAYGKPASIVLCTHWHDSREIYNRTVRQLAQKWGLPLIEFDKYIGFSKEQVHPVTKEQYSLIYAVDTQDSGGVRYGWHPVRGENSYIQQRMAAVFTDVMTRILPLRQDSIINSPNSR